MRMRKQRKLLTRQERIHRSLQQLFIAVERRIADEKTPERDRIVLQEKLKLAKAHVERDKEV